MNWIKKRRCELLARRTEAEKRAFALLQAMGLSPIAQYPIKTAKKLFFADIYIPSLRLVIEVDGGYHLTEKQKRLDSNRSAVIRTKGMHIYRFSNRDAKCKSKLLLKIKRLTHEDKVQKTRSDGKDTDKGEH